MSIDQVNEFLLSFVRWSSSQASIRGVALVGSYARQAARETSDVDLVVLADNPHVYLSELEWINFFGKVERHQIEDYGKVISLRVWYKNRLEVEFGITDESWAAIPIDDGTAQVISKGMQVLFERGNILSRLRPGTPR